MLSPQNKIICSLYFTFLENKENADAPTEASAAAENGEQHFVKVKGEATEGSGTSLSGQVQVGRNSSNIHFYRSTRRVLFTTFLIIL